MAVRAMRRDRRGWRRWLIVLVATVVAVAASLWGVIWWEERPLRQAVAALEEGEPRRALREVEEYIATHGATDQALSIKARGLVATGRAAEAIRLFERVGPAEYADVRACAQAYLMQEQWTRALPLLEWCVQQRPDDADVMYELASCQARLGRLNDALDSARQFAQHDEFAHRGWVMIGTLLRDQGNNSQAVEAWKRVLTLDPDLDDLQVPADQFLTQFAALQLDVGNPAAAIGLLEDSLKIEETAEAHYRLGVAEEQLARLKSAEEHWRRAIELDPRHRHARESLARLAISDGDGQRAEELLRPVLGVPSLQSSTAYLMQRATHLQGNAAEAESWRERTQRLRKEETIRSTMSQLLRESPDSYWGRVVRCYQFAEQANWRQAEDLLASLPTLKDEHVFVRRLKDAVRTRAPLPPTALLPVAPF